MISKTFAFTKIQKTVDQIESSLNDFLKKHSFKFATQNESAIKGKFVVTLFCSPEPGTVRAKVFKGQDSKLIDEGVNKFIAKNPMKFATQTFVGSNIFTIIFYETKKPEDQSSTTEDNSKKTENTPSTETK